MTAKPLLLLDIDGVLNPHVRPGLDVPPLFETHSVAGQVVRLNPLHGEWLHQLTYAYELVWATTWEEDANKLIAPLIGAPTNLPFVSFADYDSQGWTWKLPAVQRFVGIQPVVWLDDGPGEGAEEWATSRVPATRLIQPDGYAGWSEDEYQQLLAAAEDMR
jgi:hypothetical protein